MLTAARQVLRCSNGSYKLCDFGSCAFGPIQLDSAAARSSAEEDIEKSTTQMYRAPEMVDLYMTSHLDEKVDVWALGCIAYTLAFFMHPFQDAGNLGILSAQYKPCDLAMCEVPHIDELIQRLIVANPVARASIGPSLSPRRRAASPLASMRFSPLAARISPRPRRANMVAACVNAKTLTCFVCLVYRTRRGEQTDELESCLSSIVRGVALPPARVQVIGRLPSISQSNRSRKLSDSSAPVAHSSRHTEVKH